MIYLLICIHVGTNETVKGTVSYSKEDEKATITFPSGLQVLYSSCLLFHIWMYTFYLLFTRPIMTMLMLDFAFISFSLWKNCSFYLTLMVFFKMIPYWKCNKRNTSLRIKWSKLSLIQSYYCVQQNTMSALTQRYICSPSKCQPAVVISWCAHKAPQFN